MPIEQWTLESTQFTTVQKLLCLLQKLHVALLRNFCLLHFTLSLQPLLCPLEASQTTVLRLSSCFPPIINLMYQFAKPLWPVSC